MRVHDEGMGCGRGIRVLDKSAGFGIVDGCDVSGCKWVHGYPDLYKGTRQECGMRLTEHY